MLLAGQKQTSWREGDATYTIWLTTLWAREGDDELPRIRGYCIKEEIRAEGRSLIMAKVAMRCADTYMTEVFIACNLWVTRFFLWYAGDITILLISLYLVVFDKLIFNSMVMIIFHLNLDHNQNVCPSTMRD